MVDWLELQGGAQVWLDWTLSGSVVDCTRMIGVDQQIDGGGPISYSQLTARGLLSVTQVPDNSPSTLGPAPPLQFYRKHVPGDLRSCQPTSSFLWFERGVGERNDKGTRYGMP